jgi:hypothetical protein
MMDMQMGVLARQRHHEHIEHALGPRPEPYGPVAATPTKRSPSIWPRIARAMRLPAIFSPRATSSRPS